MCACVCRVYIIHPVLIQAVGTHLPSALLYRTRDLWQGNVGWRNRKRGGSKLTKGGGGGSYKIIRTLTFAIIHQINGKELREVKGQVYFYCNNRIYLPSLSPAKEGKYGGSCWDYAGVCFGRSVKALTVFRGRLHPRVSPIGSMPSDN